MESYSALAGSLFLQRNLIPMDEASLESIYKAESRKVFATLVRLLGDFELAEEATQEAFAAALEKWPEKGIPQNPSAWLITAGRFKTLDILKRRAKLRSLQPDLQHLLSDLQDRQEQLDERDIQDDRLRLIFTCCHPALDRGRSIRCLVLLVQRTHTQTHGRNCHRAQQRADYECRSHA